MSFTLYVGQSPNGLTPVIFAELLKVSYDLKVLSFEKGENKTPEYLEVNPAGQLPGLTYTNDAGKLVSMGESGAIITFLSKKFDKEHKFSYSLDSEHYGELLYWFFFGVSTFSPAFVGVLISKFIMKAEGPQVEGQLAKFLSYVELLDKHLEGRSYMAGDKLTFADVACFPAVRMFEKVTGKKLAEYANVDKWYTMMSEVDAVKGAIAKLF